MKRLSEKEWGEFYIGDLFSVSRPKARNKDDYIYGDVPFVASGAVNNGVMKCCKGKENEVLDAGNCLTVSPVDGSTFYQPMDFLGRGGAGSSILMLRSDSIQPDFGQFIARAVQQTCSKYSYGNMGNKDSINRERVMLPVDDKGKPDYAYMTLYSTEVRGGMLMRYKNFIAGQLSQLEHKDIPALDEKEWKKFKAFGDDGILDIATTSSSIDGIRLKDGQTKTLPYVTRTDNSNGIARFVSSDNLSYGYDDAGCITVGLDTQTAFWQPHDFVTGQNIQIISGKRLNQYLAQFIVPLLRSQMTAKFNWGGNGATLGRMKRLEIMLPVTDAGMPDYKYMEQYTKNMMLKKYEQYLAFIDRQTVTGEV